MPRLIKELPMLDLLQSSGHQLDLLLVQMGCNLHCWHRQNREANRLNPKNQLNFHDLAPFQLHLRRSCIVEGCGINTCDPDVGTCPAKSAIVPA